MCLKINWSFPAEKELGNPQAFSSSVNLKMRLSTLSNSFMSVWVQFGVCRHRGESLMIIQLVLFYESKNVKKKKKSET